MYSAGVKLAFPESLQVILKPLSFAAAVLKINYGQTGRIIIVPPNCSLDLVVVIIKCNPITDLETKYFCYET